MNRILLTIVLCTSHLILLSQAGVNQNYDIRRIDSPVSMQITSDGGFCLVGRLSCDYFAGCASLIRTDNKGVPVWAREFTAVPWLLQFRELVESEGELYAVGTITDSNDIAEYDPIIAKLSSEGRVIWQRVYHGPDLSIPLSIRQDGSRNLHVLVSTPRDDTLAHSIVLKLGSEGDLLSETKIYSLYKYTGTNNFEILENGDMVFGLIADTIIGSSPNFPGVLLTDSLGNMKWRRDLPMDAGSAICGGISEVLNFGTDGFAIASCIDTFIPGRGSRYPALYFLDTLGIVTRRSLIFQDEFMMVNKLSVTHDNGIIGCGYITEYQADVGWVFRLDHEGKMLWQKKIVVPWAETLAFVFSDIREKPDGTIAVLGRLWDTIPEQSGDLWLLTLDSLGCFTPGCQEDSIVLSIDELTGQLTQQFFEIYPNPTQGNLTLEFKNPVTRNKLNVAIFNVQGQLLNIEYIPKGAEIHHMLLSELTPGMYICQLRDESQLLQSEKFIVSD